MTNWQQGLDNRLIQRLQQPLNRKNIGQVLVDRTDKFLTRFSLVEQQFERWGKFQESNPNAVPIVYAKPTANPSGFTTSPNKEGDINSKAIAQSPSLSSPVASGNQDLVVQRRVEPNLSGSAIAQSVSPVINQSSDSMSGDPPGFATPLRKVDSLDSNSVVSNSSSDILIQRFVNPAAPSPTTDFSSITDSTNIAKSSTNTSPESLPIRETSAPNDAVILVETSAHHLNSGQENNLPLVESSSVTNETSEKTISINSLELSPESAEVIAVPTPPVNNFQSVDIPLAQSNTAENQVGAQNSSVNQSDAVVTETTITGRSPETSDLTFVTPTTQVFPSFLGEGARRAEGVSANHITQEPTSFQAQNPTDLTIENQSGDRRNIPETTTESQVVISNNEAIETTQFTDVPLVFALPNNTEPSGISREIQTSTETVLPVVKTRLEQLLSRRPRRPSQLQTVAPQNLVRRSPDRTATPLVQPLAQPLAQQKVTDAESIDLPMQAQTSVQPQPAVNPENISSSSLPLTQTKIIQTEGRTPTPPIPTNPFGTSNQTPTPIVSPQIREAANPITETFQAAMAEATKQPPVDIQAIANQVEKKLRKKMVIERERRGQGRWR